MEGQEPENDSGTSIHDLSNNSLSNQSSMNSSWSSPTSNPGQESINHAMWDPYNSPQINPDLQKRALAQEKNMPLMLAYPAQPPPPTPTETCTKIDSDVLEIMEEEEKLPSRMKRKKPSVINVRQPGGQKRKIFVEIEEEMPNEGDVQCGMCNKEFATVDDLEDHMDTEHITKQSVVYQAKNKSRDRYQKRGKDGLWIRKGKMFECQICFRQISGRSDLKQHTRTHTGERPYPCGICGRAFSVMGNLTTHMRAHTGERPYSCEECGKNFAYSYSYKMHMKTHTDEKPFQCDECGKCFAMQKHLEDHKKRKLIVRTYTCPICSESFSTKGLLGEHNREKHDGAHVCKICGKTFPRGPGLREHLRTHSGDMKFQCEHCDMACNRKTDLKRHMIRHLKSKNFKCNICGKSYSRADALTTHKKKHTGEKLYKCDVCDAAFHFYREKVKHVLSHESEKPYNCPHCDKSFRANSNLKVHIRLHTGEKPFICKYCGDRFEGKKILENHINDLHELESNKRVKCTLCPRKFADEKRLEKHMRTHNKQYHCGLCTSSFSKVELLERHMKKHNKKGANNHQGLTILRSPGGNNDANPGNSPPGIVQPNHPPRMDHPRMDHHRMEHPRLDRMDRPPSRDVMHANHSPPQMPPLHNIHSGMHRNQPHFLPQQQPPQMYLLPQAHSHHNLETDTGECVCPICDKLLQNKQVLSGHLMMHAGVQPKQCNICGLMFQSLEDLQGHMVIHAQKHYWETATGDHVDGLVQERRNSSALALELRLSCINQSISQRVANS